MIGAVVNVTPEDTINTFKDSNSNATALDKIAYDATNKQLLLVTEGADTVIPF